MGNLTRTFDHQRGGGERIPSGFGRIPQTAG
jgi:hypothetical protein